MEPDVLASLLPVGIFLAGQLSQWGIERWRRKHDVAQQSAARRIQFQREHMLELQEICTAIVRISDLTSIAQLATWAEGGREWYKPLEAALDPQDTRLVSRLKLTASRIEDEGIRQAVQILDEARLEVLHAKTDEESVRAAGRVQAGGGAIIEALGKRLRSSD